MATAGTLASAVVQISVNRAALNAGLAGVHRQLLGFIPQAQLLGGRIGGSLFGAVGASILARKATAALGPAQAGVAGAQAQVSQATAGVAQAKGAAQAAQAATMQARANVQAAQAALRNAQANTQAAANAGVALIAAKQQYAAAAAGSQQARQNLGAARGALLQARTGLAQAQAGAVAAQQAFAGTAASIGMMTVAGAAAVGVVAALGAGLASLARAGAGLETASHNTEQVFGSLTAEIEAGAQRQYAAFGQSKSEYLAYAAAVGDSLRKLGVDEDVAAYGTTQLLDSVQRLAQSKQITFGEAFKEATREGQLFTDAQLRGWALTNHKIATYGAKLNASTEALLRIEMATEVINGTTSEAVATGDNWNSRLIALSGTFETLKELVGTELLPTFMGFFKIVNGLLQAAIAQWERWKWILHGVLGPLGLFAEWFGGKVEAPRGAAQQAQDRQAIDARNRGFAAKARDQQALGEAAHPGIGGSGFAGGDLNQFARHIQQAAMNQSLVGMQKRQLERQQEMVRVLHEIRALLAINKPQGNALGMAVGAGGLAGIFAGFR